MDCNRRATALFANGYSQRNHIAEGFDYEDEFEYRSNGIYRDTWRADGWRLGCRRQRFRFIDIY